MLMADALDGSSRGGDVERASGANGHSSGVSAGLLPRRDNSPNEVSGLEPEMSLLPSQGEAGKTVLVRFRSRILSPPVAGDSQGCGDRGMDGFYRVGATKDRKSVV